MAGLLTHLVRIGELAGAGVLVLAVLAGKLVEGGLSVRQDVDEGPVQINNAAGRLQTGAVWMMDPTNARLKEFRIRAAGTLEQASVSPWQDIWGNRLAVGRWCTPLANDGLETDFGIGRFEYPSGRLLELVRVQSLPAAPPVWSPAPRAMIFYPGQDGRLYKLDFDAEEGSAHRGPREVTFPENVWWGPDKGAQVLSACRPKGPGFGNLLVVSIRIMANHLGPDASPEQIWWLRLDSDESKILEGHRLTEDRPKRARQEHLPAVYARPGGPAMLAYVAKNWEEDLWELRIAPLREISGTDGPRAFERETRVVARRICRSPIQFTERGDRILYLGRRAGASTQEPGRLASISITEPGEPALGGASNIDESLVEKAEVQPSGLGSVSDSPSRIPFSASLMTTSSRIALSPTLP